MLWRLAYIEEMKVIDKFYAFDVNSNHLKYEGFHFMQIHYFGIKMFMKHSQVLM